MNIANYPIFKLLLPYILGVIIAYLALMPNVSIHLLFYVMSAILLISVVLFKKLGYNYQWIAALFMQVMFLFAGFLSTQYRLQSKYTDAEEVLIAENSYWIAQIIDNPLERTNSMKCVATIKQSVDGQPLQEKVLLYIQKTPSSLQLQSGDIILIKSNLSEIAPPRNPYAFDYQQYMKRKGVFFTGYVPQNGFVLIGHLSTKPVKQLAYRLQQNFAQQFARAGLIDDEYSIITAILLGNDDTMDPALQASYASTGVSHILCVSGMHVGLIFMILNFILKPLDFSRKTSLLKSIILLLSVWSYAYITGLSPSVQRSAVMFTFVFFGDFLNRNTNIFHSLYTSLFLLLLIDPLLLCNVGFQLSYLAVFGIVIFQKPITMLWKPKNKIMKYFWELITVSMAAQLSTFPIAIYYFGQFPNYFLLANLSIMLLSFIIIVNGIVLLVVSFSGFLAMWTGKLLIFEIKGMNGVVRFIENLPGALTENISVSPPQVICLYIMIFALYLLFTQKRKFFFWAAYSSFALYALCLVFHRISVNSEESITVYALPKKSAINFNMGGKSILLHDYIEGKSSSDYNFNIHNHERIRGIESQWFSMEGDTILHDLPFYKKGALVCFGRHIFFFLDSDIFLHRGEKQITTEYLYLRKNPKNKPEEVVQSIRFEYVIIDETVTPYYENRWIEFCEKESIPFYSVRRQGALVIP